MQILSKAFPPKQWTRVFLHTRSGICWFPRKWKHMRQMRDANVTERWRSALFGHRIMVGKSHQMVKMNRSEFDFEWVVFTRSSLPETNWSDEKTYRHTSASTDSSCFLVIYFGFLPSRDWDPKFHFLFFIKKYQLRDAKTIKNNEIFTYIYHINWFIWFFSSTVVIDMSSQIENRMGWVG